MKNLRSRIGPALLASLCLSTLGASAQAPRFESNGAPDGAPESALVGGAVAHLRLNSAAALLESLDAILLSMLPEKALPPRLQPLLQRPQPALSILTAMTMGAPLTADQIPAAFGVAVDRPITVTYYAPDQFVVSVPLADGARFAGLLNGLARTRDFQKIPVGNRTAYLLECANPSFPRQLHVVNSSDRAFICPSLEAAQGILEAPAEARLNRSGFISEALEQNENADLTILGDPSAFKGFVPLIKARHSRIPEALIERTRAAMLGNLPANQKMQLEMRLRWQLGIADLEQALDFVEVFVTSAYELLADRLIYHAEQFDGLVLAIDLGEKYHRMSFAAHSGAVRGRADNAIPLDAIRKAADRIPGDRNIVKISGRRSRSEGPSLEMRWIKRLEAKFTEKELPMVWMKAMMTWMESRRPLAALESKVPWKIQTPIGSGSPVAAADAEGAAEYVLGLIESMTQSSTATMMPAQPEGFLEKHFAELAADRTHNEKAYRRFLDETDNKMPFYRRLARSQPGVADGPVKRLVFEDVFVTSAGLFGYSEHELINRKILSHRQQGDHLYFQEGAADSGWLKNLEAIAPAPGYLGKLLDRAPADARTLDISRALNRLTEGVAVLTQIEKLIHKEADEFLEEADAVVKRHPGDGQAIMSGLKLLDVPISVMSLSYDKGRNEFYGTLIGGLPYPRPPLMPEVARILKDFTDGIDSVGGGVAYTKEADGRFESGAVVSTEGLGLLLRTAGNNFFAEYMTNPAAMQKLHGVVREPFGAGLGYGQEGTGSLQHCLGIPLRSVSGLSRVSGPGRLFDAR